MDQHRDTPPSDRLSSTATADERPTNRRWVMFGLAAGTSFILYLHRYTWNFVRPELVKETDFTNTQLDTLFTLFNGSYAAFQIPAGIVCDLFGPHLFLGITIGLWSLLMPMVGIAGGMTWLSAARLGFGAAQAGCYPALTRVTREWFPPGNRTVLQGWIASFFGRSGGAVSSIVMGGVLMGTLGLGWRTSLIVLSTVGLVFAVVFTLLARNSPDVDPAVNDAERNLIRGGVDVPDSPSAPRVLPLSRAIRNPSLLVFSVFQYLNAGADYVFTGLMGSYFVEGRGVQDQFILGLLVSLPLWGGACGGVVGGILNDVLIKLLGSRRWARSLVGFSGKILASVCLYFSISHPDAATGAWLLFATKFFTDWTQPTVWGTSTDMGGRYSATVFSIINAMGSVGAFVTPMIGGWLLDRYTVFSDAGVKTTHFGPVFVMVGVMYLLSAVCWLFINCTNSLDRNECDESR